MESHANHLDRIEDSLSQCLSQSKRPLGLLLGAGCPVSIKVADADGYRPLIPDIAGLTSLVNRSMEASSSEYQALLSRLRDDLDHDPNIEEILSHIRGLAMIVGRQRVHGLDKEAIDQLERAVTTQIMQAVAVDLPSEHTPYDDLAVWSQAVTRHIPIRIFTTNYDLLLEAAFERSSAPFFDGFAGAREPFLDTTAIEADDLPPRWTRIIKLHGSSNWVVRVDRGVVRVPVDGSEERRLIHPSHLKYTESRRMPYLVMFDQLRDFLKRQSATLITLGYSFRDDHINDLLAQGLRANASAKIFGLQYGEFNAYDSAEDLARQNVGLTVMAANGGIDAGRAFELESAADRETKPFKLGDFKEFGHRLMRSVGHTTRTASEIEAVTRGSDEE
ncbi:MAG: SIR2 family protein [Acidimicrobiaceae bacterium]|nr:SIR2 family protein [Acidimicrobiaceae bacterium]